ncbi:unnamed protein product [Penicillium camemberti]|uniref:Str. FM013 n=1 Tax=Penicillium camemberti (strain FM 013) TaxID=1429867 RepID=A0A0G4PQW1_PENC3|nr:unnamed protein product [Penicillium camemberti]
MARRKRIRTEQSLPTEEKSHATECDDQQMMERRSKEIDYKMSSMPPSKLPNLIKRLSWAIERTDKLCSPPPNLESNADDGNPSRDFGITHQPRKSDPDLYRADSKSGPGDWISQRTSIGSSIYKGLMAWESWGGQCVIL